MGKQPLQTTRRESGHTLIEVSIAAGFLTMGVLGLVPLLITSNQGLTASSKVIQASSLAESKISELEDLGYDAPTLAAGNYEEARNLTATGVPTLADGTATGALDCTKSSDGLFARSWEIKDVPVGAAGALNAKEITVTVCWWDRVTGTPRRVTSVGGLARPR